jgi:hypothetical protein
MPSTIRQIIRVVSLATLAVAVPAYSQGPAPSGRKPRHPPQEHPESERRDTQTSQRGTDSTPLVVRISPSQIEQLIAAQKAEHHEQKPSPDWWMIGLTGILAAGTVGLWLATKQLVRGAESTAKRQLRAYLNRSGKPEFRERIQEDQSKIYDFLVPLKNSGQTPAYDVTARGRAAYDTIPLPDSADLTLKPAPQGSRGPVGPGQEILVPCTSDAIGAKDCFLMYQPVLKRTLYLIGEVSYVDAFKARHTVSFCEAVDWSYVHSVQYPTLPTYPVGSHNKGD